MQRRNRNVRVQYRLLVKANIRTCIIFDILLLKQLYFILIFWGFFCLFFFVDKMIAVQAMLFFPCHPQRFHYFLQRTRWHSIQLRVSLSHSSLEILPSKFFREALLNLLYLSSLIILTSLVVSQAILRSPLFHCFWKKTDLDPSQP